MSSPILSQAVSARCRVTKMDTTAFNSIFWASRGRGLLPFPTSKRGHNGSPPFCTGYFAGGALSQGIQPNVEHRIQRSKAPPFPPLSCPGSSHSRILPTLQHQTLLSSSIALGNIHPALSSVPTGARPVSALLSLQVQ